MPAGRKPLSIAEQVDRLEGSPVARARLRVILANLAGQISVAEACAELGIEESWFFELKHESLKRFAQALEPGTPGRPAAAEPTAEAQEIAALKEQTRRLGLELKAARLREELAREGLSRPEARRGQAAKKARR
jgi:hypothetical protein